MLRLFARRGGTDGVGAGRFAVGKEVFRCIGSCTRVQNRTEVFNAERAY